MKCLNCNSKRIIYVNNEEQKDAYKCLDCNYTYPKQYFFISHSHLDIEKVRIIRNTIEETFFYEPILFFLKGLSDEKEIKDLLKREIYERVWFIYCDSENARKSMYVQHERNYVNTLIEKGIYKHLINIDVDKFNIWDEECINYLREQIKHYIKKTKLFFSFAHNLKPQVLPLIRNLEQMGYAIFDIESLKPADNWFDTISEQIEQVSYKDGVFVQIIKDNISKLSELEISKAQSVGAFILRIVISNELLVEDKNTLVIKEKDFLDANYLTELIDNYLKQI